MNGLGVCFTMTTCIHKSKLLIVSNRCNDIDSLAMLNDSLSFKMTSDSINFRW